MESRIDILGLIKLVSRDGHTDLAVGIKVKLTVSVGEASTSSERIIPLDAPEGSSYTPFAELDKMDMYVIALLTKDWSTMREEELRLMLELNVPECVLENPWT